MHDMSDIADALTIRREMKDLVTFEGVRNILTPGQARALTDILYELNMIKAVPKENSSHNGLWTLDIEYEYVWVE